MANMTENERLAQDYFNIEDTVQDLGHIQSRIYLYDIIPLAERDRLSMELYKVREVLKRYAKEKLDSRIDWDTIDLDRIIRRDRSFN